MPPAPDQGSRQGTALATRSTPYDTVAPVVAVAAALYLAFVLARLAAFGWDPSVFVVAGDGITDVREAPAGLGVHTGVDGYDGQAYYRLARDPLTTEVSDHGIGFTRPAYWQTRIGYPATVWVLSAGGREALVPLVMLGVNLLAVVAIAAGTARLARDRGLSPWLALVPTLWAGYLVGVAQDLTEPLAGALLVGALLAFRHRRWALATAALTAAALTRETSLVLAVAVLAVALIPGLRRLLTTDEHEQQPVPWWAGAVPIAVYAGWRTWVRARWADVVPEPPADNPLGAPFVALARYLADAVAHPVEHADNLVLLVPALVAVGVLVAGLVAGGGGHPHERLALAAYLVLLACLPVWDRGQAYLRWCCEPVLLGWLVLLAGPRARLRLLGAAVALLWIAASVSTHRYPDPDHWLPAAAGDPSPARPTGFIEPPTEATT